MAALNGRRKRIEHRPGLGWPGEGCLTLTHRLRGLPDGAARDGLKYLTFWRRDGVGNVIFLNLLLAGLYRLRGKRHPCA